MECHDAEPGHDMRVAVRAGKYEVQVNTVMTKSGKYIISAWVFVTNDYDGTSQLLRSKWYNGEDVLGTTEGAFNATEGQWQHVQTEFNASSVPTKFKLSIGYPQQNTKGFMYVYDVSVTDSSGSQFIQNGRFSGGTDIAQFQGSESTGAYSVVPAPQQLRLPMLNSLDGSQLFNLARGKPAAQSSGSSTDAARVVDGVLSYRDASLSCMETKQEFKPWWRVDLEVPPATGSWALYLFVQLA